MAKRLTKGFKLGYKASSSATETWLEDMFQIPDVGGVKDSVEVTTFDNKAHMFINGLISYGDSLDFQFYHVIDDAATQTSQLETLQGFGDTEKIWVVGIPDGALDTDGEPTIGTKATFSAQSSVKIDGKGINEAISYTLSLKPTSEIDFTF